jgi:ubiquinone/menaquinone biosynthesis C-methylase UbiE
MSAKARDAVAAQRRYYTDTAARYDCMHAHESDDDQWNLQLVCALLQIIGAKSILDVGAGTGRGMQSVHSSAPSMLVCGAEPVAALIDEGIKKSHDSGVHFIQASGDALPFADDSFDAVCSFGILHHVPEPKVVVGEMLRVARKAVLVVDSNRFGQGPWPMRAAKLLLYKAGLWPLVNYAKTRARGYVFTEGDGIAFSYSAYDSFDQIAQWADRLMVIPSQPGKATSWLHPLLTATGVLVGAFKEAQS